jgi:hypothetical protein
MRSRRQFDISNQNLSIDIVGLRFSSSGEVALSVIGCVFSGAVFDRREYLLVIVVCYMFPGVGCGVLTVDCRVSVVVVGSWLSGVGGCSWFLEVGCRYRWL